MPDQKELMEMSKKVSEMIEEINSEPFTRDEVKIILLEKFNKLPLEEIVLKALKPVFDKGLEGSKIVKERDELKKKVKKLTEICRLVAPGFDLEREVQA